MYDNIKFPHSDKGKTVLNEWIRQPESHPLHPTLYVAAVKALRWNGCSRSGPITLGE